MASVFEEKNVSKAIMAVGLPAMLGQLTTLIYNLADTLLIYPFVPTCFPSCNYTKGAPIKIHFR